MQPKKRKGAKFWTIRMDSQGLYCVVPALFQRPDTKRVGAAYYKVTFKYEDRDESVTVSIEDRSVFPAEGAALLEAARRCRTAAVHWMNRADELAVRAAQKGGA